MAGDQFTSAAVKRAGVNAAEDALETYHAWSGLTRADGAAYYYDAIADILHAARKRGFGAGRVLAMAESHFAAEGGRMRRRATTRASAKPRQRTPARRR